ncbi:RagB/SusD family nutrient uptake outer membrane protein [Mariniflexile sp. AS56]|uniref:RagB/SusD family nutrient uptake outer membrane protein n=1 Tax=Mariniflexile sp. AS56 TaxID=3063957 RepID=UPI0026EB3FC0|nr:RagB/SusD family nutrient uptake outer membrane protein [Mariniflexile sp. AS56]MDO7171590.1 RagB/SusD family nutrient uptake outer membrane protein [Mariniflexile sp. AS56]
MKTKKIKYFISSIIMACFFSCDSYIDVVPDNIATIDIAFNNRDNAERFFYTLYHYMPSHGNVNANPGLIGGDEVWINPISGNGLGAFKMTQGFQNVVSPELNWWSGYSNDMFVGLRDCNIFLENIDRPRDLIEEEKTRWIAETKFLKAYYHFWLLRMYGPIPIIDQNTPVGASVEEVRLERDKVDDVVNYIVSLLDEAMVDLPPFIAVPALELGRATQPIAASIKAQVLAFAASPLLNGNPAYSNWVNNAGEPYVNQTFDITKWEKAAEASAEAIMLSEENGHSLYKSNGSAQFTLSDSTITKLSIREAVSKRWNPEIIWGNQNSNASGLQSMSFVKADPSLTPEELGQAATNWSPTLTMAELFYSDNGVPIEEDLAYDYAGRYGVKTAGSDHRYYIEEGYQTASLHFNREPRFHASLGFDGSKIYGMGQVNDKSIFTIKSKNGQPASGSNDRNYSVTGYYAKKLINLEDIISGGSWRVNAYPFPVIRLSDMYLLYAECSNEAYGPSAEVYDNIDIVRERAGLDGVVASWAAHSNNPSKPNSKEGLREIIHQERLIELSFEGHRFWDLRRWLKAQTYLDGTEMKGWSIKASTVVDYYKVTLVGKTAFSQKNYFWPIKESDLLVNPNLDQAPGW